MIQSSGAVIFPRPNLYRNPFLLFSLISFAAGGIAQSEEQPVPDIRVLRVELDTPAKVKRGIAVKAHTIEPLYNANRLVIPAGTVLLGKVSDVHHVSKSKRAAAISHGDFTPLHDATLQFDSLRLRDGAELPILTAPAQEGSEVVRFQSTHPKQVSLVKQAWNAAMAQKDQAINTVTAPGKMDRLRKYVYSQLPWHPEIIDAGSQYDVTLLSPVTEIENSGLAGPTPEIKTQNEKVEKTTFLRARLQSEITSKTGKQGDPVDAVVTQPVINREGQIEIPQGAILRGRILRARAAKKWGKNGALRFTFNRVDFPQGVPQQVSGVPSAVDGQKNQSLKLDSEGGVEPNTNKGVMLPLALGLLATSAFMEEEGGAGHSAIASNGFGLIARVVAISSGSKTFGGVVGAVDTGRTVYTRFIAHGRDVVFPRNSEVEVEVGPIHKLAVPAAKQ